MLEQLPVVRDIADLMSLGGIFVFFIFMSGVLMWALIIERLWYFKIILPRQAAKVEAEWRARSDHTSWCARQIRQTMISRLNGAMTAGFPVMQVLVPMAPLLGLIGTVSGMLDVFDSMASGVSAAMICTMTGLAVSITGLYPVHYFRTKATRETELLADKLSF